jgi:hypothetical protein
MRVPGMIMGVFFMLFSSGSGGTGLSTFGRYRLGLRIVILGVLCVHWIQETSLSACY